MAWRLSVRKLLLVNAIKLDSHESSVHYENQPDPPRFNWFMALNLVKIGIIELVNTIKPLFILQCLPNLYGR